jgi:hypothetical protein
MFIRMRALWAILILIGCAARALAESAPDLDALFQRTNDWIGADGDYSIQLNARTTLWLFGDTVIGQVRDGKRVHAKMVNNSIALQPIGGAPQFFYRTNSAGAPGSVFTPAGDTNAFFWPWDGIRTTRGLFIFFMKVRHTAEKSVWGFNVFGTTLAFVPNPDAPPSDWKISLRDVPYKSFGLAVVRDGEFIYVYGRARKRGGTLVARAPLEALDEFGQWHFYDNGQWQENITNATAIFPDAPPEATVKWMPAMKRFVTVYSPDIFGDIVMRTAETPTGPWSARRVLFHCPEASRTNALYCYAAKLHPELGQPGELVVSYAVNSNNFFDLFNDAGIYWPRFLRFKL